MQDFSEFFSPGGPLAKAAPGYSFRPGQLALANAIGDAMEGRSRLVAEAGTGVGKTFAYLVPLLLSHGKSLISTATRHLQDQLYQRDLPRIKAALGASVTMAMLKGRSNYLCIYRMEQHQDSGRFHRREDVHAFGQIARFAQTTVTGDISECADVPETSPLWSLATSTRENCLGQNCPKLDQCHVMAARKAAAQADVVVINHHLLCADMALRDDGFGELLPEVEHVVIDEAHALPEIASVFFGQSLSTQMLALLARDVLAAGLAHARDGAAWPELCGALEKASADLRMLLAAPNRRLSWDALHADDQSEWLARLADVQRELGRLDDALELNAERHLDIAQAHARCLDLRGRLEGFVQNPEDVPVVRWMESSKHALTMHVTPYDIRDRFREELLRHQRSWIMVSATLAIGASFRHFQERLGMEDAETLIAQSPFDFASQGLLLVPQQAPDPKAPDLIVQLLDDPSIMALMDACPGGIFLLCTSLRAVGLAKERLMSWSACHPDRLLLVQGDMPRHTLIEQFRSHGHAVLVGSHSFWEGVDVPGKALSMVLIDKLPFAPPDDPVLEARARWLERQGRDAFMSLQVPQAAIQLKQGVGRLIRSESDRGLVVIGDKRLAETPYGRKILHSLPAFARTRDAAHAAQWLTRISDETRSMAKPMQHHL